MLRGCLIHNFNACFQFSNNITHFFTYTYFHTYFQTTKYIFLNAYTKHPLNALNMLLLKDTHHCHPPPTQIIPFPIDTSHHSCQNPDLDLTILRFYDSTYSKRSRSFKDLSDRSGSVGSHDFDDPKQLWFLIIFFNLTEGSVGPK